MPGIPGFSLGLGGKSDASSSFATGGNGPTFGANTKGLTTLQLAGLIAGAAVIVILVKR